MGPPNRGSTAEGGDAGVLLRNDAHVVLLTESREKHIGKSTGGRICMLSYAQNVSEGYADCHSIFLYGLRLGWKREFYVSLNTFLCHLENIVFTMYTYYLKTKKTISFRNFDEWA